MAIRGCQRLGCLLPTQFSIGVGLSRSCLRIAKLSAASFSSFNRPTPTLLNEDEPSHGLPNKWKIRYIELTDMPSESKQKPLSYEEYKQKNLLSFEEYEAKLKPHYKDDTIKKAYEVYCRGSYKGYLIELEQINPGVIL